LRLKGSLGGDYYLNLRKQWLAKDAWRFSQTPGNPWAGNDGLSVGTYGERQGKTYNLNKELTLTYTRAWGEHSIDLLAGASEQYAYWYVNDLSGNVNYASTQYRGISNVPPFTNGFANYLQEDDLIGYIGRVSYKYADKYYVDATLRRDGSSKMAPARKWETFPSFSLAWRISKENFFPQTNWLDDLKLRGGWGRLGNVQSARYYSFVSGISFTPDYALGLGSGNGVGNQTQGAALPDFANTELTWEKARSISAGFDAVMFRGRFTATLEYYNKTTFDIIQSVRLPPNTGIENNADLNIAQVKNSGIELQLGYNNKIGPVDFGVTGNITTTRNRVVKLYLGNPIGGNGARVEEGYSMFYLWGYKVGGVFQNQAEIDAWRAAHADGSIGQDLDDPSNGYEYQPGDMYFQDVYGNPKDAKERFSRTPDSLINDNDRTYLGKTIPGYYYGVNFTAAYKGFDLSIFFQGVGDVQKYNGLRAGGEGMGGLANQWSTVLGRWTPTNASTTIPRAVFDDPANANRYSSRFVEDAGYLRLKNLQLGYSIPRPLLQRAGFIQNFRVYASAVNLFTITKWTGLDPENDFIPPTRQFVFGVTATF
jgi:TonB-linked SusC/RagA family outer membrane protein